MRAIKEAKKVASEKVHIKKVGKIEYDWYCPYCLGPKNYWRFCKNCKKTNNSISIKEVRKIKIKKILDN